MTQTLIDIILIFGESGVKKMRSILLSSQPGHLVLSSLKARKSDCFRFEQTCYREGVCYKHILWNFMKQNYLEVTRKMVGVIVSRCRAQYLVLEVNKPGELNCRNR